MSSYAVFSMGPLLVIVIAIAGLFFGQGAVHGQVTAQLIQFLGDTAAKATDSLLAGASHFGTGLFAVAVGLVVLVITALGVVVQLDGEEADPQPRKDIFVAGLRPGHAK